MIGRLDRLDGHEGLGGTLWDDEGAAWRCLFPAELERELPHLWRRRVEVEGTLEPARGRKQGRPLRVERIRAVEGARRSLLEVLAALEPLGEDLPAIEELPLRPVLAAEAGSLPLRKAAGAAAPDRPGGTGSALRPM